MLNYLACADLVSSEKSFSIMAVINHLGLLARRGCTFCSSN